MEFEGIFELNQFLKECRLLCLIVCKVFAAGCKNGSGDGFGGGGATLQINPSIPLMSLSPSPILTLADFIQIWFERIFS